MISVKSCFSSLIKIPVGGGLLDVGDLIVGIVMSSCFGPREVCWMSVGGDWTLFNSKRYCFRAETRFGS